MSTNKGVAGLNVYKKVAIIRKADDVLTYEDGEGNVKTITDLHLAASATAPIHKAKPKHDIPVPKIRDVETYHTDVPANYGRPVAYVRHQKPSHQEIKDNLEYVIDAEDEIWLTNNAKFGKAATAKQEGSQDEGRATVQLPLEMMEVMMDVMEKATAFDTIIRTDQAEEFILKKLPQLYHMYPVRGRAGSVTIKQVISDVYNHWVSKRSKLKRPLLRRFWPVTSTDDTNPHLVFRPREKEKYKLRKKRQNDMDAYRKMEQLRQDFGQIRILCELVKQREQLTRSLVLLQREWFRQKIYEAVDTSGQPRISKDLSKDQLLELTQVEKYFDASDGTKRKKQRRGSSTGAGVPTQMVVPILGPSITASNLVGLSSAGKPSTTSDAAQRPMIVAGQNHGEPAPNFMNPLSTREAYRTSWEGVPPHVTTFVNAKPEPTFRFRHRPRVGRGGRLCIDRFPLPPNPNAPTFYRAGNSQIYPNEPKPRLVDLLPPPLDRERLSQRIEAVSLNALKEDYEGGPQGEENDGDIVLVPIEEWLNTDDQIWGEERFSLGPI
mmetsp:Transcript_47547/g.136700  ORF Transcript_47547/g.136700 Transcript_47547/m.136700 type:complete len:549 (-) Transcript_47547:70-1716(-)|eukprot:CAMPEP_0176003262 /NCGR_PEP_ID=MMETSP0120_2-20121206/1083_1 /TAXON_ID=160619 /ORGANISM="Kryptoperidinium foliaceum, Strain CCMP 1326" /LENGTH=548 /DNA_ID=CAMNT_0017335899 /DNA_START=150 /DNA_END=1796 /DNA_ORIENTATION=+